jgi:hypothetical protein
MKQGCRIFQNSRRQNYDMKQVTDWESTNTKRHRTKFSQNLCTPGIKDFYETSWPQFESLITYLKLVLAVSTRLQQGSRLFLCTTFGNTGHIQIARSQSIWHCKWRNDGVGFSPTSVAATDSFQGSHILQQCTASRWPVVTLAVAKLNYATEFLSVLIRRP